MRNQQLLRIRIIKKSKLYLTLLFVVFVIIDSFLIFKNIILEYYQTFSKGYIVFYILPIISGVIYLFNFNKISNFVLKQSILKQNKIAIVIAVFVLTIMSFLYTFQNIYLFYGGPILSAYQEENMIFTIINFIVQLAYNMFFIEILVKLLKTK